MSMSAGTRYVTATASPPHFFSAPWYRSHLSWINTTLRSRCSGRSCALLHQKCLTSSMASATPQRFESTHTQRDWNPEESESSAAQESAAAVRAAQAAYHNEHTSHEGARLNAAAPPAPAAAHPYFVRAYRARLMRGTYTSIRELTRAAYAPAPLNVLTDLLQLSVNHSPRHTELSSSSSLVTSSPAAPPSLAQSCAQKALSRARDVHHILQLALTEAQDTVLTAQTLGDSTSHVAMRELLAQLETLANAMDACVRAPPPTTSAQFPVNTPVPLSTSPTWTMPVATHASLLHGLLRLAGVTGAHLQALAALNDLLSLQERELPHVSARNNRSEHRHDYGEESGDGDGDGDTFSLDDALVLVDAAAQQHVEPVTAQDHLCAMQACAKEHNRDFATALSLYRRFLQHAEAGRFTATPNELASALVALAHSSRTTTDFTELRALLVESEAAAVVPVSVPLYTALIGAASRAVEEPQRMTFALHMYRRLRDGGLALTADTYAALIACCASTREPTHAFAFYHEARQVCGTESLTPQVYTNLLLSYTSAGFGADARKTLDVLVEAGAPLSRASFHAVLAGSVTVREAQAVVKLMTERYHIAPTPHTYAYVTQAVAKSPSGASMALQLFDIHEDVMQSLAHMADPTERLHLEDDGNKEQIAGRQAMSTSANGVALEPLLLERYPLYVRALEQALMHLRVDPSMDSRLKPYLMPLIRVAQQRMNAFTGMSPQSPTRVPQKERLCIAVLAADVLANLDEWVLPFISHYSVLVIPYSALVSLQRGGGRRVDGVMPKGVQAGLYDAVWQETAGGREWDAVVEHRRRRLARFLEQYKAVIHLMSLEEELRWSRETRRYGIGVTDLFARAAATALHLARCDNHNSSVYAQHHNAAVVLVSASYDRCGKYVVTPKQAEGAPGLRKALRRVSYHNPRTNPNWVPPTLAIAPQEKEGKNEGDGKQHAPVMSAGATDQTGIKGEEEELRKPRQKSGPTASYGSALETDAAWQLYRSSLLLASAQEHEVVLSESDRSVTNLNNSEGVPCKIAMEEGEGALHPPLSQYSPKASSFGSLLPLSGPSTSAHAEDNLDAHLLMSLLND
ncbi:hypothetical protein JKF63_06577 [Porcisia hertigi]|uniref:Pentacotripeptide-repeat region of PRORP domain-containing protein n=1 Tax=Porcisia hertigi TaxID=2761500 RepID=A0A836IY42_9TRYP|nr:hypothetical protein JKF63_06577 [Porcisia hertigi]